MKAISKSGRRRWARLDRLKAQAAALKKEIAKEKTAVLAEFGQARNLDLGDGSKLTRTTVEVSAHEVKAFAYDLLRREVQA